MYERIYTIEHLEALAQDPLEKWAVIIDIEDGHRISYANGKNWYKLTKTFVSSLDVFVDRSRRYYMVVGEKDV